MVTFVPQYRGITKSFYFIVYYQLKNDGIVWLTNQIICLTNTCTVKNLRPRSLYYVWVTAANDFGESNNSKIVLIQTKG